MLPLADEEAQRLLAAVPEAARKECWWLVRPDGTLVRGDAGGGVALLSELRLTRPLGRTLHALRAGRAVDGLDKILARYRARLGKFVPDREPLRRYP